MRAPIAPRSHETNRRLSLIFGVPLLVIVVGVLLFSSCQPEREGSEDKKQEAGTQPVVDVTAVDYAFQAPDTIPSGWLTFRMTNEGTESHHFYLYRLPEGKTFANWQEAIKEPIDSLGKLERAGKIDSADVRKAIDRIVPNWTMLARGGMGLVAPGHTGQTTHHVDPGRYVMICGIATPSGRRHDSIGVVAGVVAADSSVGRSPPTADGTVRLAGHEIRMDDTLTPGSRTVGFRVEEVPDGLRDGTDGYYSVWLARLSDTTSAEDVAEWDFQNPAPYESLGGFEYLPPDQAAYVTADVQLGRYAWVWGYDGMEVLGDEDPMVKPFSVE